jgi:serine protease AprX
MRSAVAGFAGVLVAASLVGGVAAPAAAAGAPVDVIVRTAGPVESAAARDAVVRAGGSVGRPLDLISGFAARVPAGAVAALRRTPSVTELTADASVRMQADKWIDGGGKNTVETIKKAAGGKKKDKLVDTESLTGAGIGVALIDSGIAPVKGLNQAGKVINGPDLSFESQAPNLRQLDTFGHGTHMAGIIAGSDPATATNAGRFEGVAPGANVISLKVASADGATDVSQVIAAIDWVVTHRTDPGLNIRVLNLSFGTDSVQDTALDPLSFAVEAAWRKGIVVVVAIGNEGTSAPRVTMPAANPYVIAVGAADPKGTEQRTDDTAASFSSRGNNARHADILAAGASVVSLRAPGSYIDTTYPGARITDADGQLRLFRGSGTSQAAAVVSGSVALLLQHRPTLTPDEVKKLLMQTADPIAGADPVSAGAGQIDIAEAAATKPKDATQKYAVGTGMGTLEGARGTAHVADSDSGAVLAGELDVFGVAWNAKKWAPAAKDGKAWTGGTWNGSAWTGSTFTGTSWAARTWSTTTWTGRTWSGSTWSGRTWSSAVWNGSAWTGRTWSGRTWSGRTWSSAQWCKEPWS